jgi:hypothetical protein
MLFMGISARRRRKWLSMLALIAAMTALGSLVACSGSSNKTTGTSAGTYEFTVTGDGNDACATTAKTTFTVTVE